MQAQSKPSVVHLLLPYSQIYEMRSLSNVKGLSIKITSILKVEWTSNNKTPPTVSESYTCCGMFEAQLLGFDDII